MFILTCFCLFVCLWVVVFFLLVVVFVCYWVFLLLFVCCCSFCWVFGVVSFFSFFLGVGVVGVKTFLFSTFIHK